ncbi:MAG: hypothetical protein U9P88_02270 [Patescibacteria group bacterium]|nr:hypothetical protein [Patescibacteria group bacterium]
MTKIFKKINGNWLFFILVLLFYLILLIWDYQLAERVFVKFLYLIQQIIPVLLLVFAMIFLSGLFLSPKKITNFLGKDAGLKGWIVSIIGGILSAGPLYMWYPLLKDLKEKGTKNSFIACFLYSRAVKISLFPIMIYYFSFTFTIILSFYIILFSFVNGILVDKFIKLKK